MSNIERRRTVVTLYQGDDLARLSELRDKVAEAADREAAAPRRQSTKSQARALAQEHDELQDAADESAVKVTVWALTNDQYEQLSELHPARDGDANDAKFGQDMSAFPKALLRAGLLDPDDSPGDAVKAVERGAVKLAELGDLTRLHARKLENAAWNVNVEDDTLPKVSLVSLLRRECDDDSEQPHDSEQAQPSSTAARRSRRTASTTPPGT